MDDVLDCYLKGYIAIWKIWGQCLPFSELYTLSEPESIHSHACKADKNSLNIQVSEQT